MRRLNSLDGLRAFAVMLVFASHMRQQQLVGGYVGVDIFFVISGYLITLLLISEYRASQRIGMRRFYTRRALRLWPALLCVVVFAVITGYRYVLGDPLRDGAFAAFYLTDFYGQWVAYFQPLLHTWSLAVEEQFYLLWPCLLLIALRRGWRPGRFIWGLIVVSVVVTAALGLADLAPRMQYLPTSHVPELAAGALLAFAVADDATATIRKLSGQNIAVVAAIAAVAVLVFLPPHWWAFPAVTLVCFPLVSHLVLFRDSRFSRLFSAPPGVWLGKRSYGFYLWHYPLIMWTGAVGSTRRMILELVVTLVVTELSWRLVETPFLRLKGKFEPARRALTVANPSIESA